jgi:hypothetical protein
MATVINPMQWSIFLKNPTLPNPKSSANPKHKIPINSTQLVKKIKSKISFPKKSKSQN